MTSNPPVAAALEITDVSKTFGARRVLDAMTLTIPPGEIHVLLGQNGSGKSTLIKILAGFHEPDPGGEIRVAGEHLDTSSPGSAARLGLRFVHQDLGLIPELSVADNVFLGGQFPTRLLTVQRSLAATRTSGALAAVGLDLDPAEEVGRLTPAQQTGVAIARALGVWNARPSVLILDEPTATLPDHEVEVLLEILRTAAATGVAIIYITHHLDEIPNFAHRVTVIRDGRLIQTWAADDIDRRQLVHQLIGEEQEQEQALSDAIQAQHPAGGGPPALRVTGLHAGAVRGVDVEVVAGEAVGLYGLTGSGRETVLGAVFGALPRDSGVVEVDGVRVPPFRPAASMRCGLAYTHPDRKRVGGVEGMTARENLFLINAKAFMSRGRLRRDLEVAAGRTWFARLRVHPQDGLELPLGSFSGGNQQKILIGKWLRQAPKVLLLDEPTQGVDVGAKAELHRQFRQAAADGAALVVSSSDVEELAGLCDRVLVLRNGRVTDVLDGPRVTVREINQSMHASKQTDREH